MQNERESLSTLTVRDYDIAGNLVRAFVAPDGKIVFVLDLMVDESKPNVLLVMNPVDNRKWDDVLENDYGVDLETVRPKKNNKYQKLDIEYSGLSVYQDLIDAYAAGDDLTDDLAMLKAFRKTAVRRAAQERLSVAEMSANNARDTIDKTNDSIQDLNARMRQLRVKLAELRKNIGKEPTKQSAAKILRVESQIDATNEKIKRAKKRLDNAQKRLAAATDDADEAYKILAQTEDFSDATLPMIKPENPIVSSQDEEELEFYPVEDDDDLTTTYNTGAEEMADEDVKPLFDTDPEILDEEIAFKPIDFSAPVIAPEQPIVPVEPKLPETYSEAPAIEPLTFTPPIESERFSEEVDVLPSQMAEQSAPVLNSITSVENPDGLEITESQTEFVPQPVVPVYAAPAPAEPAIPEPDVAPAAIDSGFRPVSPITGVATVATEQNTGRKQGVLYYVLLIMLVVLSVFVLWLYQKSTGGSALPNIADSVVAEQTEPVTVPEPEPVVETVVSEPEPEPVVETVVPEPEPEPVVESEPEPVVAQEEPVSVEPVEIIVPVEMSVVNTVPTVVPEPEVVKVETEEEILAKKPAYGVSQNEKMFVADEYFETDRLGATVSEDEVVVVDMYDTPIIRPNEQVEEVLMCDGGAEPDRFGCCPGESYVQIDNGGFVCCPDDGGDCFPPLY